MKLSKQFLEEIEKAEKIALERDNLVITENDILDAVSTMNNFQDLLAEELVVYVNHKAVGYELISSHKLEHPRGGKPFDYVLVQIRENQYKLVSINHHQVFIGVSENDVLDKYAKWIKME